MLAAALLGGRCSYGYPSRAAFAASAMSEKPQFAGHAIKALEKLSLGERSGWRARSSKRVAQLKTMFQAGQFGQSCACGATILGLEDLDGNSIIDDGCSTVQALMELKQTGEGGVDFDAQLIGLIKNSLRVNVLRYSGNDSMDLRRAWSVGKHDEEASTVLWSSVAMKVQVAKDLHA